MINGFDIPKLYFHEVKDKGFKFAVVDGKQRLNAIWSFLDNALELSEDFEFWEEPKLVGAGRTYSSLPPKLQTRFDEYKLPVQIIYTRDLEWVEELFSRLNEAVALNAPERRNALGGPIPPVVRRLPQRLFFSNRLPFENNRYRHYDLATKFLFLEYIGKPEATKRTALDAFVLDLRDRKANQEAAVLEEKTVKVLERLEDVFGESDVLLSSLGLVVIYYLLERDKILSSTSEARRLLAEFHEVRRQVRSLMRVASTTGTGKVKLDPELVEFERLSQSPNDVAAMTTRMQTLTSYIQNPKQIRSKLRAIT